MWADTLLRAEQLHFLQLLAWGALAVVTGTALLVAGTISRLRAPLLRQVGLPLAFLGAIEVAMAAWRYSHVVMLDVAGAARLEHLVWLELGLFLGVIGVGATLSIVGWALARSRGAVATGIAVALHGAALTALDLLFVPAVSR